MRTNARLLLLIIAVSAGSFACGSDGTSSNVANSEPSRKGPPVPAATIDELASGKQVFETNCILCHRSDGTGGRVSLEGKNLNVENLTSAKFKSFSDEKIIGYVMKGVEDEGMPAFEGKLSEGEMRDVVKYIRVLQKKS